MGTHPIFESDFDCLTDKTMKFSVADWHNNNRQKMFHAERSRTIVENLRDDCGRALEETEKHTRNSQRECTTRLGQRVNKVNYWKSEIDEKLEGLNNEIDALLHYKNRVESALEATIEPTRINTKCQSLRDQRVETDDCHDMVERDLSKEIGVMTSAADLLKVTRDKISEQIRKDRSARYYLEKDHRDKQAAAGFDTDARDLHNNSSNAQFRPITARQTHGKHTNPVQWQNFTEVNIAKAERERQESKELRSAVDSILRQTTDDMIEQNKLTSFQFKERVKETKIAKTQLTSHLDKVMGEISELEKNMKDLQEGIKNKEGPLMVSQTRQVMRQGRPNVEYCVDPPHSRLRRETAEIQGSIQRLRALYSQCQVQMKDLLRQQLSLQEEIKVKENTIYIDEVCCMADRESIKLTYY